jgi:3D (Asp-Asp-Asp) domain-containing protein/Skp family chaperone for outer membrane proteins
VLLVALAAAALVTGSTPASGGAETAPSLSAQARALRSSESGALLELYAAESAAARARAQLAGLEARSASLTRSEQSARKRTRIVQQSFAASQARVALLLRDLYVQGEPDPIAVILGATSLDEALTGIEELARATALNERLGAEATRRAGRLKALRAELATERRSLDHARADAAAGARQLASAVAAKQQTVDSIRRQQSLTSQRLAALESRARAAQQQSATLTSTAATGGATAPTAATTTAATATTTASPTAPGPTGPATGTRSLVVDAVAYHLPGNTASGLPVGVGVIAVDPNVIPLGTRLFVPGYGPAVAADVGSAVKGNIIDLWMPSTKDALAWGRRTVTVTIYG